MSKIISGALFLILLFSAADAYAGDIPESIMAGGHAAMLNGEASPSPIVQEPTPAAESANATASPAAEPSAQAVSANTDGQTGSTALLLAATAAVAIASSALALLWVNRKRKKFHRLTW